MQERLEIQLLMIKVILNICLILYHIIWHWDYYFQNWLTYLIPKLPFYGRYSCRLECRIYWCWIVQFLTRSGHFNATKMKFDSIFILCLVFCIILNVVAYICNITIEAW